MNDLTKEWVDKAEGDLHSAQRETRARKNPNYDSACFHAQQCVEKYMKAILQEAGIPFGKTHNLTELLDQCVNLYPAWELHRPEMLSLNVYAVAFRYPGENALVEHARAALRTVKSLRSAFRGALGLPL